MQQSNITLTEQLRAYKMISPTVIFRKNKCTLFQLRNIITLLLCSTKYHQREYRIRYISNDITLLAEFFLIKLFDTEESIFTVN